MTLIMTVIVPCERLVLNDHHYDGHSFAVYGPKYHTGAPQVLSMQSTKIVC